MLSTSLLCQSFRQVLNYSHPQPFCSSRYSQHPACCQIFLPLSQQCIQQWANLLLPLESQPLTTSFLLTPKYWCIHSPILLHSCSCFKMIKLHMDYLVFIFPCLFLLLYYRVGEECLWPQHAGVHR